MVQLQFFPLLGRVLETQISSLRQPFFDDFRPGWQRDISGQLVFSQPMFQCVVEPHIKPPNICAGKAMPQPLRIFASNKVCWRFVLVSPTHPKRGRGFRLLNVGNFWLRVQLVKANAHLKLAQMMPCFLTEVVLAH